MTTLDLMPALSHASGGRMHGVDGTVYLDLVNGFGAVFLGHCRPSITAALVRQASQMWTCGRHAHPALAEARTLIDDVLPTGLRYAGLYSTGMEVAEFALRLAVRHTGHRGLIGFTGSMHGKSAMTAALGWHNAPLPSTDVTLIPLPSPEDEAGTLERLATMLRERPRAAVFVEPIQGSNAAHEASIAFHDRLVALCAEHGTLVVFDEILTGLYRTGTCFYSERLARQPDILLFAKCMANGFPVASIALREPLAVRPDTLPGSTFSGNPLAAAAVCATLSEMKTLRMTERVAAIETVVREKLGGLAEHGVTLRGRGALWVLEASPRLRMRDVLATIVERGVLVSGHGDCIRLLPAATIEADELARACDIVAAACIESADERPRPRPATVVAPTPQHPRPGP